VAPPCGNRDPSSRPGQNEHGDAAPRRFENLAARFAENRPVCRQSSVQPAGSSSKTNSVSSAGLAGLSPVVHAFRSPVGRGKRDRSKSRSDRLRQGPWKPGRETRGQGPLAPAQLPIAGQRLGVKRLQAMLPTIDRWPPDRRSGHRPAPLLPVIHLRRSAGDLPQSASRDAKLPTQRHFAAQRKRLS